VQVTVLGGGAAFGFAGATRDTVTRLLNGALVAGLNVIDTAEYSGSKEPTGLIARGTGPGDPFQETREGRITNPRRTPQRTAA
jgi:hypothetical protein